VTDYQDFRDVGTADPYIRVLLTSDNSRLFICIAGYVSFLDTATDTVVTNTISPEGDYELTLSSKGTWMSAAEYLMDTNLNPQSYLALNEREIWNQLAVYGEKISPDGNLLFAPLTNAIDVYDGRMGLFRRRVALPFALCPNYDALVSDGQDNVLVAITGQNGDGIAVIDLSSLPEPLPLPYSSAAATDLAPMRHDGRAEMNRSLAAKPGDSGTRHKAQHRERIPHIVNHLAIATPTP
jgi:hypothetical protein